MKISKLFHWLYGVIMLLPVFAIGVTSLVSTFNMSAKQETEITYKYQTNEVNSANDLVEGNIYNLNLNEHLLTDYSEDGELVFVILDGYFEFEYTQINPDETFTPLRINKNYKVYVSFADNVINLQLGVSEEDVDYYSFYIANNISNIISNNLTILLISSYEINNISAISKTAYNEIENVETHNLNTQDVFYSAIDKVQQSPLFNWAYNSFLVTPFAYIVSLFSMPTNSFVVMLLSYWLAISIIWLVFDLIMYLPLLFHRMIDKGVLE